MDSAFKKVFFAYHDDSIVRVEELDLLGDRVPQLLIITESAGTNDRTEWHILSEINGKLMEWKWPEYDGPAAKLLRSDESFCCKDWNLHLKGADVFLARGIYHQGDGNCCPSRGGALVRLRPVLGAFKIASIQRVSKPDYKHWRSQPFCMGCVLVGD